MASYFIQLLSSAQKELDALDGAIFARIDAKVVALADEPRPSGCRKLKGHTNQWRIRVGDWRVVYVIQDETKRVLITRIAHRREVYDAP